MKMDGSMEESKKDKFVILLGRVASTMSVLMYVSYIPQIAGNLSGYKGNPIQPFVAMVNCIVWTAYGLLQKKKTGQLLSQTYQVLSLQVSHLLQHFKNF